jgi:hypothetical protein
VQSRQSPRTQNKQINLHNARGPHSLHSTIHKRWLSARLNLITNASKLRLLGKAKVIDWLFAQSCCFVLRIIPASDLLRLWIRRDRCKGETESTLKEDLEWGATASLTRFLSNLCFNTNRRRRFKKCLMILTRSGKSHLVILNELPRNRNWILSHKLKVNCHNWLTKVIKSTSTLYLINSRLSRDVKISEICATSKAKLH